MPLCCIHQAIGGRQTFRHAEVGIPTWGSQMKIPPTIEPIAHISPYRRIDPSHDMWAF
jgi:hypothetical protein